jgi:hypothetical protein
MTSYTITDTAITTHSDDLKGNYISHDLLSFGDFDNSTDVQRANVAYIVENYAKNRYTVETGSYGYNQLYLKNTKINRVLIDSLDQYPLINDEYYYEYQEKHAKAYFNEHLDVADFPLLANVLYQFSDDTEWKLSDNIYTALQNVSNDLSLDFFVSCADTYYFSLQKDIYNTVENQNKLVGYLVDSGIYSRQTGNDLLQNIEPIVDTIYKDITSDKTIKEFSYCLQLYSYNEIVLRTGSIDYMLDLSIPTQELTVSKYDSKKSIISNIICVYDNLCEYNYEQLDLIPT